MSEKAQIYVVLNPIAGNSSAEEIREMLDRYFSSERWDLDIYETTGKENVAELVSAACQNGAEMIVAAGGDGTVAGAVNGLVGNDAVLGIIPVGTGNGLARALEIPLDLEKAVSLLAEREQVMAIDAMQVGDRYYVLNVSAGISAKAMSETPAEQKRTFGMLAYAWTIIKEALAVRPRRFSLTLDNHQVQVLATEILVSNGRLLKERPFPLGPRSRFNDKQFDVYIVTARTLTDYLQTLWQIILRPGRSKADLRTLTMRGSMRIEVERGSQPVQADGEVIGITPVEITLVPDAVQVVVPESNNGGKKHES